VSPNCPSVSSKISEYRAAPPPAPPKREPDGIFLKSPEGSVELTGLFATYAYLLSDCGSVRSQQRIAPSSVRTSFWRGTTLSFGSPASYMVAFVFPAASFNSRRIAFPGTVASSGMATCEPRLSLRDFSTL
jgi:hypothetical protein